MFFLHCQPVGRAWEVYRSVKSSLCVGRSPDCDLPLHDSAVSRVHGEFYQISGKWWYRNLVNRNGTTLERAGEVTHLKKARDEFALLPGDILRLGDTVLVFAPPGKTPFSSPCAADEETVLNIEPHVLSAQRIGEIIYEGDDLTDAEWKTLQKDHEAVLALERMQETCQGVERALGDVDIMNAFRQAIVAPTEYESLAVKVPQPVSVSVPVESWRKRGETWVTEKCGPWLVEGKIISGKRDVLALINAAVESLPVAPARTRDAERTSPDDTIVEGLCADTVAASPSRESTRERAVRGRGEGASSAAALTLRDCIEGISEQAGAISQELEPYAASLAIYDSLGGRLLAMLKLIDRAKTLLPAASADAVSETPSESRVSAFEGRFLFPEISCPDLWDFPVHLEMRLYAINARLRLRSWLRSVDRQGVPDQEMVLLQPQSGKTYSLRSTPGGDLAPSPGATSAADPAKSGIEPGPWVITLKLGSGGLQHRFRFQFDFLQSALRLFQPPLAAPTG